MATDRFQINVPQDKIDRLHQKLAFVDFPEGSLGDADSWSQGPPVSELKRLATAWQKTYDWRKAEADLNTFPQYISEVEIDRFGTYTMHHIHMKSSRPGAIPLLFLHGWPGSFIEVTKMARQLVRGDSDSRAFHVIAPSLIGFGFSSRSGTSKFQIDQHAEACDKLMKSLGYDAYVIQAGDVGSLVARYMAFKYASRVRAYHTNTPVSSPPKADTHPQLYEELVSTPLTAEENTGLARTTQFIEQGRGYYMQQSTKPRTLGFSLKDSPVGLLAWLYEKMHDWSDGYPWTDEEILTWVSIYYFSCAGPDASSDVYYAMEHSERTAMVKAQQYCEVPFGVARFLKDLIVTPKLWNKTLGPVVFESEHSSGGHFAAWERPDAIVADLRAMFARAEDFGFAGNP